MHLRLTGRVRPFEETVGVHSKCARKQAAERNDPGRRRAWEEPLDDHRLGKSLVLHSCDAPTVVSSLQGSCATTGRGNIAAAWITSIAARALGSRDQMSMFLFHTLSLAPRALRPAGLLWAVSLLIALYGWVGFRARTFVFGNGSRANNIRIDDSFGIVSKRSIGRARTETLSMQRCALIGARAVDSYCETGE